MREIKFRAWDKEEKRMVKPFSFWVHPSHGIQVKSIWVGHESIVGDPDDFELMQYTGLKDMNGTYIFEGDILGGVFEPSIIEWCNVCKSFQLHIHNIMDYGPCQQCEGDVGWSEAVEGNDLIVIGNKYENPDLLK